MTEQEGGAELYINADLDSRQRLKGISISLSNGGRYTFSRPMATILRDLLDDWLRSQ